MIVVCPACQAHFEVETGLIGPAGRNVRCSECDNRWLQRAETLQPEADQSSPAVAASPPLPPDMAMSPVAPTERLAPFRDIEQTDLARPRNLRMLGFTLAFGLLVGLCAAAYLLRETIMNAVPASGAIYALIGLRPDAPASILEIANIRNEERVVDARRQLDISGVVFNPGEMAIDLPEIVIAFTNADGAVIDQAKIYHFRQKQIDPGENLAFRAENIEMPDGVKSFQVGFAPLN